jgi:hypothetical protein
MFYKLFLLLHATMARICSILLTGILCTLSITYALLDTIRIDAVSPELHNEIIDDQPLPSRAQVRVLTIAKAEEAPPIQNVHVSDEPLKPLQPIRVVHAADAWEKTDQDNMYQHALLTVVDQDDIRPGDKILLDKILRWMPPPCRNNIDQLVVRYDPKAERGLSSASTILLRGGMSMPETIAVMIHECGHIIDLGGLQGTRAAEESVFPDGPVATFADDPSVAFYTISWETTRRRRSSARSEDFVSGYAQDDPFEDLAESVTYYALHKKAFEERAKTNGAIAKKLAWVKTYVFTDDSLLPESKGWDGKVVWDVTKLEHTLRL